MLGFSEPNTPTLQYSNTPEILTHRRPSWREKSFNQKL
jgi:hypothetical protein